MSRCTFDNLQVDNLQHFLLQGCADSVLVGAYCDIACLIAAKYDFPAAAFA